MNRKNAAHLLAFHISSTRKGCHGQIGPSFETIDLHGITNVYIVDRTCHLIVTKADMDLRTCQLMQCKQSDMKIKSLEPLLISNLITGYRLLLMGDWLDFEHLVRGKGFNFMCGQTLEALKVSHHQTG